MDDQGFDDALHVVGDCAAGGSLAAAFRLRREQVLVNEDFLAGGPVPAIRDLGRWRATRERFMQTLHGRRWPDFTFDGYADNGLLMNAARLGEELRVFVWVGCGLSEQLLLAWSVFLFDQQGLDPSRLRVLQFEGPRRHQRTITISELRPDDIRAFLPEPQSLGATVLEELRRTWCVYTSNDPKDLARYVAESGPLPILRQAMGQVVLRYPDHRSGLNIWDERLLHYTKEEGPTAVRVIGHTMGWPETVDWVGDTYLFNRLISLGSADLVSPLVSITGDTAELRDCRVTLTAFGEQVLASEANHVKKNGIDDWIGGVHLRTGVPVTYRDGDSLIFPD